MGVIENLQVLSRPFGQQDISVQTPQPASGSLNVVTSPNGSGTYNPQQAYSGGAYALQGQPTSSIVQPASAVTLQGSPVAGTTYVPPDSPLTVRLQALAVPLQQGLQQSLALNQYHESPGPDFGTAPTQQAVSPANFPSSGDISGVINNLNALKIQGVQTYPSPNAQAFNPTLSLQPTYNSGTTPSNVPFNPNVVGTHEQAREQFLQQLPGGQTLGQKIKAALDVPEGPGLIKSVERVIGKFGGMIAAPVADFLQGGIAEPIKFTLENGFGKTLDDLPLGEAQTKYPALYAYQQNPGKVFGDALQTVLALVGLPGEGFTVGTSALVSTDSLLQPIAKVIESGLINIPRTGVESGLFNVGNALSQGVTDPTKLAEAFGQGFPYGPALSTGAAVGGLAGKALLKETATLFTEGIQSAAEKVNLATNIGKLDAPVPSTETTGSFQTSQGNVVNVNEMKRGLQTVTVPNEQADFYFRNNRLPTADEARIHNYQIPEGQTTLYFDNGKLASFTPDNATFGQKLQQDASIFQSRPGFMDLGGGKTASPDSLGSAGQPASSRPSGTPTGSENTSGISASAERTPESNTPLQDQVAQESTALASNLAEKARESTTPTEFIQSLGSNDLLALAKNDIRPSDFYAEANRESQLSSPRGQPASSITNTEQGESLLATPPGILNRTSSETTDVGTPDQTQSGALPPETTSPTDERTLSSLNDLEQRPEVGGTPNSIPAPEQSKLPSGSLSPSSPSSLPPQADLTSSVRPVDPNIKTDLTPKQVSALNEAAKTIPKNTTAPVFVDAMKEIRNAFNPVNSPSGEVVKNNLRAAIAKMEFDKNGEIRAAQTVQDAFKSIPANERLQFIQRVEEGLPQPNQAMADQAVFFRNWFEQDYKLATNIDPELPHMDNYFAQSGVWRDPQAAREFANRFVNNTLGGSPGALEQRVFPTINDGIQAGLQLKESNPMTLALNNRLQLMKANMATEFKNAQLAAGADPSEVNAVVDRYLSNGLNSATTRAIRTTGGLINSIQLGASGFHVAGTAINASVSKAAIAINDLLTGNIGKSLENTVRTPTASIEYLLRGDRIIKDATDGKITTEVQNILDGGGRIGEQVDYKTTGLAQAIKNLGDSPTDVVTFPFKLAAGTINSLAKPVMSYWVPRMKVAAVADGIDAALRRLPDNATPDMVQAAKAGVVDSVDNRFGQLIRDNLFWNKQMLNGMDVFMRSPGWNIGTVRELGLGAKDLFNVRKLLSGQGISDRAAYTVALPIVTGLMGAAYHYLHTGQAPKNVTDLYYPQTGQIDPKTGKPERVSMPTYMKDVFSFYRDPMGTLANKTSPLINLAINETRNRDYFGNYIRNPDDPLMTRVTQGLGYAVKGIMPFSLTGTSQRVQTGVEPAVENFFGFTKAPAAVSNSQADTFIQRKIAERFASPLTPEQQVTNQGKAQLEDQFKAGNARVQDLQKAGISAAKINELTSGKSPIEQKLDLLSFADRQTALSLMSPEEKAQVSPRYLTELQGKVNQQAATRQKQISLSANPALSSEVRQAKGQTTQNTQTADDAYQQIMSLPDDQRAAAYDQIYSQNPSVAKSVAQKVQTGQLSTDDQVLKSLPIANRADYIYHQALKMGDDQQRAEYVDNLIAEKVATKAVLTRLNQLVQQGTP